MNRNIYLSRVLSKLFRFFPKNENSIVLYSTGEYSANLLAFYRALCKYVHKKSLNITWIEPNNKILNLLQENGINAVPSRSKKAISALSSSKFLISSHGVPLTKARNQISIELWHGIPLKSIGRFYPNDSQEKLKIRSNLVDYFIATSSFTKLMFAASLGVSLEKFLDFGSPVTDVLFNPSKPFIEYFQNEYSSFDHVFFYLPTYRNYDRRKVLDMITDFINSSKLISFLQATNSLLLIKPHPWDERELQSIAAQLTLDYIQVLSNDVLWKDLNTIYDVLAVVDTLITDYSSVYFDYLLLNRPIVFYVPDLERYSATRGFLLEPYDKWTPGDKARNVDELINALKEAIDNPNKWRREREWLKDVMFKYQDGKASERIIKYFWGGV